MPRIDPNQLLKCLSVLLSPTGGIKSSEEVSRFASLMTKFSKKLVSKCIYVMILKATETPLLDAFMKVGGWDLTYNWLSDSIVMKNWPLVEELVQLLVICPVDIERLKGNNCPKLIKVLSKDTSASENVRQLACSVVDLWLTIVKGACAESNNSHSVPAAVKEASTVSDQEVSSSTPHINENVNQEESDETTIPKGVYKITIRNGKKVLAEVIKTERSEARVEENMDDEEEAKETKNTTERSILKVVNEDPIAQESLPPKKLAEGKRQLLSLKRKNERKPSPEPAKPTMKEKKKNSIEKKPKLDLKSKIKDKKTSEKFKEKTPEEKAQEEKDKQNLLKLITPSIGGVGKIPKKSDRKDDSKKDEKKSSVLKSPEPKQLTPPQKDPKKYNISIETRKTGEDRPKTVKTFNSRFRSTGLEELPPPPKNAVKKKEEVPERKPVKRPSPIKELPVPEKKPKDEEKPPEKPPVLSPSTKPKISGLQESDVFADALTAANPVSIKKRKRRMSNSNSSSPSDPKKENSSSKTDDKEAVKPVFKFYQDTLITSEEKPDVKEETKTEIKEEEVSSPVDPILDDSETLTKEELEEEVAKSEKAIDQVMKMEEKRNVEREKNRLPKGILTYMKKNKALKKSVSFRDKDLVQIKHFELDETERVNVTKTFMDMRQMEKYNERILFQRKLVPEDNMEEKTPWRPLIPVDIPPSAGDSIVPGQNSIEKDIQQARERTTLQAIYFNRSLIPDSPQEPDLEIHALTEPATIPLKDTTGNPDSVISYKDRPWPEPKGFPPGGSPPRGPASPPQQQIVPQQQPQQQPMVPIQGMFPPQQFPPQPPMQGFMPPGLLPTPDWMGNPDGNMMMNGPPAGNDQMMMGGMNPGMPPGLLPPPDMYNMGGPPPPEFMGGGPPPFGMGGGPPGPPGMFPGGPAGYPPDNGPPQSGPNQRHQRPPWFRGGDNSRGGGGGGTWRHPSKGGGGGWNQSNKMCKFYLKKGSCRQNNCAFRHGSGKGGIR